MATPKKKQKPDPETAAVDATLKLAAERRWREIGLAEIAEEAGVPLAELHPRLGSKQALLDAFMRRIDAAVLAEEAPGAEESARDRLFDVLMRRFDALQPHRLAIGNILDDQLRSPGESLCSLAQLGRSMGWMLAAAGIPAEGLRGVLRVKGLSAIWLSCLRVFLRDDSADLSKTMAALDGALRRVEWLVGRLERGPRRRGGGGGTGETGEAAAGPATEG